VVRAAARAVRRALEEVGLVPFAQTSGSRGFHVVGPLRPDADVEVVKAFADDLAILVAGRDPERLAATLHNDLEPAAFDLLPGLPKAKQRLVEAGALGAVMSGSGPTMLGLCRDEEHATLVARAARAAFARVEVTRGPVPGVTFG